MCEKLSHQIIDTLGGNQAVFCYYWKFAKIIIKKKILVLAVASNAECTFLNSFKTDLAKLIWVDFDSFEFFNIHIFNWYKSLCSASSSTFRHIDFIRASR